MRADMEVAGLLAMLMPPAIEVCGAEEDNTVPLQYLIVITCSISSVTVGHRGTTSKRAQTGGEQDPQMHKHHP